MSLGYKGGVRRITMTFTNTAGELTDPTAITVEVLAPAQAEVTLTWPAVSNPPVTRDPDHPTGVFQLDWPMAVEGTHSYKVTSTGAIAAAARGQFVVVDTPHD